MQQSGHLLEKSHVTCNCATDSSSGSVDVGSTTDLVVRPRNVVTLASRPPSVTNHIRLAVTEGCSEICECSWALLWRVVFNAIMFDI